MIAWLSPFNPVMVSHKRQSRVVNQITRCVRGAKTGPALFAQFVVRPVKPSELTGSIPRSGTFVQQLSVTDEGISTMYWLTT